MISGRANDTAREVYRGTEQKAWERYMKLSFALRQGSVELHNSEGRVVFQALANHLFVTRFEDVQRQRRARKQYEIQREDGKKGHEVSNAESNLIRLYDTASSS